MSATTPTHDARRSAWAPVRAIEREAQHLHEVERAGESEWTPWLALAGLVLFLALVSAVIIAITFGAYDLGL